MLTKKQIIEKAYECEFADIGFTTAAPFNDQKNLLQTMLDKYAFLEKDNLNLIEGTDPEKLMPGAKSIIVLVENYFKEAFPPEMAKHFGRCYLDDDRVTRDGLAKRIKAFRGFLRDNGIQSKMSFSTSHRNAALRAGLGSTGKNCFFYSRKAALKGSWVLPMVVMIDAPYEPDSPMPGPPIKCPSWCKNACVAACPTRAIKGNRTIDPRKCISYLSYNEENITPLELREPMGLYVYGCDTCQEICPRNRPWLAHEAHDLAINEKVAQKAPYFELTRLLHMDTAYFNKHIYPHMFYLKSSHLWKWKMNVARVMGNSLEKKYLPHLAQAFKENEDDRVLGMVAWAVGRIGGSQAELLLKDFSNLPGGQQKKVAVEIENALSSVTKAA